MPTWFTITTIVFFLVAIGTSIFSIRHYACDDLLTGNLTEVAEKMVSSSACTVAQRLDIQSRELLCLVHTLVLMGIVAVVPFRRQS